MRFTNSIFTLLILSLLPVSTAFAWDDLQSLEMAQALGSVLGSEQACDLQFSQTAIQRFIEDKVPASDMQFTGQLMLMTQGSEFEIQNMSTSAKTAHCTQTERVARNYGFID